MNLPDHLRHFTDRDEQLAAFDALWDDARWALTFSGVSGAGKSHLIEYLIETRCKPRALKFVKVDFDAGPEIDAVPVALASLVSGEGRADFEQAAQKIYQEHQAAMLELAKQTPRQVTLEQRAEGGGQIQGSPATIDVQYLERRRDLTITLRDRITIAALDAIHAEDTPAAVLFLDTYEKFADNNEEKFVAWLWSFLAQATEKMRGLRVVVAGREQLPYAPIKSSTRVSPLSDFDPPMCDRFLGAWGIDDAALRHAAFQIWRGHALTTRMFAEAYDDARKARRPITLAELRSGTMGRAANEWIYDLMLSRLPEPQRTAANYGPLLRHFNQGALMNALDLKMDDATFHQFVGRSFVKRVGVGDYKFHETVRQVQRATLYASGDPKVIEVHQRAAQFYDNSDGEGRRDRLYHLSIAESSSTLEMWKGALGQAAFDFEHEWWNELLEAMETPSAQKNLTIEQRANVLLYRMQWHYYHLEELDEGLRKGKIALELFRAVGDRLGEANTLRAIGDVQRFRKENDAALESYRQALELFRAVGDRVGPTNIYWRLGRMLADNGNVQQAIPLIEQAVAFVEEIQHPIAPAWRGYLEELKVRSLNSV